jgi:hypothetical protein
MLERLVPEAHNIQVREGEARTLTLAGVHR